MHHPTAQISPLALIEGNVEIGAFTIIHPNVKIGCGTRIGSYCEIGVPSELADGKPLTIGERSLIRSYSLFYEGSTFGHDPVTGHRVTVREKTTAGINMQIGTLSDIQGTCSFGDYVRLHSNVHIGNHSTVGNFVWIFPYVVLTNDPHPPSDVVRGVTIEDYVAIATMSVILPAVKVAEGALIGAHSSVSRDVAPNTIVVGSPAKEIGPTSIIKLKNDAKTPAYPWRRHFHRGYPEDIVQGWLKEFPNG